MNATTDGQSAPREVWVVVDHKFGRRVGREYATRREAREVFPSYSRYSVERQLRPAPGPQDHTDEPRAEVQA